MANATIILTCGDNYIYLYPYDESRAFVVDPGDASAVSSALGMQGLTLTTVLLTHHHWDHTAGVAELKSQTGCEVVGPNEQRIGSIDRVVTEGDALTLGTSEITVLATPGHTRTSVCFLMTPDPGEPGVIWTGDTLFVGGCGRPMECDASVLWQSLARLAALPDETLVYCGHDYTAENYEFALTIEPDNQAVQKRLSDVERAAADSRPSVPSTIVQERATNIFLRAGEASVGTALGMSVAEPEQVFTELRRRKNLFG